MCVENVPESQILGEIFSDSVAPQRGPGDLHLLKRGRRKVGPPDNQWLESDKCPNIVKIKHVQAKEAEEAKTKK